MMTGVAHADQSDILEPFGGSAHPGVIVDTQIAELPATNIPIPHTLIAQLSTNEDDVNDPLESVNRVIFGFNEIVYEFLLTPVATTYNTVLHETVRSGVSNAIDNISSPVTLVNDILQFELDRALTTIARFVVNTIAGIGGIADVASSIGLEEHSEDFGQTLGSYGVGEGLYLVLPLLGPSNPRDAIGDLVVDPMCGRGTIPIESTLMAGSFGVQHFSVGGDKQERCIQDCMCNISTASEAAQRYGCDALQWGFRGPLAKSSLKDSIDRRQSLSCDIIKWDAFRLPFRAGCVDAIVCETPHDQNCKMKKHLVTPLWKELFRVLKVGGRAVLAIKFKNAFKKTIEKIDAPLSIERTIEVCVRGLVIHLFVVVKGGQ